MTQSPPVPNLIFDTTMDSFETDVLQRSLDIPILLEFWAQWCEPCKVLGPVLEKLVADFNGAFLLAKIDIEAERELADGLLVRSVPTVYLIKNWQSDDVFQGVLPEGQIRQFLQQHGIIPLPPERADTPDAAPNPEAEAEVERLRALSAEEPDQPERRLELALALVKTGQIDEARSLLDGLPANLANDGRAKTARARLGFAAVLQGAPSKAELEAMLSANPDDHRARHQLGVRLLLADETEAGLDQFLDILRRDRQFDEALGKRALIDAFQVIDDAELISHTRRKMSTILF